jgi:hypothetical protein
MTTIASHRIVTTSRTPIVRETRYERIVAGLWAIALSLFLLCSALICVWLLFAESVVLTEPPIGGPNGGTNEIGQPEPITAKATAVEVPDDSFDPAADHLTQPQSDLAELVATMTATSALESADAADKAVSGSSGDGDVTQISAQNAPIGTKRPEARSRRWIIEVLSPRDVGDYAAMLREFAIEPAVVYSDGRVVYLNLNGDTLSVRHSTDFEQEDRFYTRWDQGDLKQLDEELFASAGVDSSTAIIVHFFSAATEQLLEQKSLAFAGRSAQEISRTWFRLSYRESGSEIEVARQLGR